MPEVPLGELDGQKGNFVDGPFGSNLKASEYTDEGTPIIRLQNIRPNQYIPKDVKFVSEDKAAELSRHNYQPGDVVIAKLGAVGTACIIPDDAESGIIVADVVRFRGDKRRIDYSYLCHFLNSQEGQRRVLKLSRGTTRLRTNLTDLKKVEIPLPPLAEQKRIAAILDKADALRRKRQQAIDLADQFLRSVFLEMFGDPVSNPKGWPVVPFQECLSEKPRNGLSPASDGTVFGRVLTLSAITRSKFDPTASKEVFFSKDPTDSQKVNRNDLLICRGNGNLALVGCGRVPTQTDMDTAFPDTMIAAKVNPEKINMDYLEYLWNSPAVREHIEINARTTNGTFKINQGVINTAPIMLPSTQLQRDFMLLVEKTKKSIKTQIDGLLQMSCLFSALSQKAFRGEL